MIVFTKFEKFEIWYISFWIENCKNLQLNFSTFVFNVFCIFCITFLKFFLFFVKYDMTSKMIQTSKIISWIVKTCIENEMTKKNCKNNKLFYLCLLFKMMNEFFAIDEKSQIEFQHAQIFLDFLFYAIRNNSKIWIELIWKNDEICCLLSCVIIVHRYVYNWRVCQKFWSFFDLFYLIVFLLVEKLFQAMISYRKFVCQSKNF